MRIFKKLSLKKWLIIACAAVIVCGAAAAAFLLLFREDSTEPETIQLYYNLDREEFISDSETGYTTRAVSKKDGLYHVTFATEDGSSVRLSVADKDVIREVDARRIMGLKFDKDGIITDVYDVEQVTGGYTAKLFYVAVVDGNIAYANSSYNMNGVETEVQWTDSTKLIDVSGYSGLAGTQVKSLQIDDYIIGINNTAGELAYVYILDRQENVSIKEMYCPDCGETVMWKSWASESSLPTKTNKRYTHFFLTKDITLERQQSIQEDTKICLDLNGYTVTGAENKRMYSLHYSGAALNIFDTSQEQTGKFVPMGTPDAEGVCVWVRYGTFNLYGGTFDCSQCTTLYIGAAFCINRDAVLNMKGGTVIGGTAIANRYQKSDGTTGVRGGNGGNVYIRGTFNMSGGTISGGVAKVLTYQKDDGTTSKSGGYGGNVYVGCYGVFNLTGGTVEGGVADQCGGNISTENGKLSCSTINMSGGTVSGGKSLNPSKNGGSIYLCRDVTMNMSGGLIEKGTSANCGGNIDSAYAHLTISGGTVRNGKCLSEYADGARSTNVFVVGGTFKLSGGTIVGGLDLGNVEAYTEITLSGSPTVYSGKNENNFYIPSGKIIHADTLRSGANIHVTAYGEFSDTTVSGNDAYFTSDIDSTVFLNDGKLFSGRLQCVCGGAGGTGHTCTPVAFAPTTYKTTFPRNGNYYLLYDLTLEAQAGLKTDKSTAIDLNGKTIQCNGNRAFMLNSPGCTLYICDTKNTATVLMTADYAGEGGLIHVQNGSLYLFGGTFDGNGFKTVYEGKDTTGGMIRLTANAKAYMYGGTVRNGSGKIGGNIVLGGAFTMYGGTISGGAVSGGSASFGGNIYVSSTGKLTLAGGTITGGTAEKGGGNISTETGKTQSSILEITGGKIEAGTAKTSGGNIYLAKDAALTVKNAQISGGTATEGGNIYNAGGTVTMESVQLLDGTAQNNGGNITNNGVLTVKSSEISGGTAVKGQGGNIKAGGNLTVADSTVSGGKAGSGGGNIYQSDGTVFTVTGSVIENGEAKTGGNITVAKTVTLENCTVSGGKAVNGGNINIAGYTEGTKNIGADVVLTSCTVSGGVAENEGGNTRCYGGLTLTDTTVTGGSAKTGGGIHYGKNDVTKTVTLVGNTDVSGNSGADIYFANKSLMPIDITRLSRDRKLNVTTNGDCTFAVYKAADADDMTAHYYDKSQIALANAGKVVFGQTDEEALTVTYLSADKDAHIHCICGGTIPSGTKLSDGTVHYCKDVIWSKATAKDEICGYCYLANDITLGTQIAMKEANGNAVIAVCLNDHFLNTSDGKRAFSLTEQGARLTVTSCAGGKIQAGGTSTDEGGTVFVNSNATLNLYAGEITGGNTSHKNGGGNIRVAGNATFNMYGGKVSGGIAAVYGGNISLSGTMNLLGGTVQCGLACDGANSAYGGNIYVRSGGTLNIYGGEVRNGSAYSGGGNISTETGSVRSSVVNMYGGKVFCGATTKPGSNGGNITVSKDCTLNLYSGEITGGTSQNCGGNITVNSGIFNMSGGTVSGGSGALTGTYQVTSGNVFSNGGKITMSGGTIAGGLCALKSANAYVAFTGTARVTGGATNIALAKDADIRFSDLREGAQFGLFTVNGDNSVLITSTCPEDILTYVASDDTARTAVYLNAKLYLNK